MFNRCTILTLKIESVHDNFPYCATSKEAFIFMSHWRVQLFFKKLIHPGKKESLTTTLLLKKRWMKIGDENSESVGQIKGKNKLCL